jgi:hypothetical protein
MNQDGGDPIFTTGGSGTTISRVRYFDGQRLTAADLNDAATAQREYRWLLNRSLHNWGIGLGFAVSGEQGDRQVTVQPGYAIDRWGREVLLAQPSTKAVPARSQSTVCYLVAAYPDDSDLAVQEQRQGDCGSDGAVRLQEQASIYWRIQGEQSVETGIEIVLAQATIQNCQLAAPLSLDQRRSARATQHAYIASGETSLPNMDWQLWKVSDDIPSGLSGVDVSGFAAQAPILGVRTTVDTTVARFGAIPDYQAQLQGPRVILLNQTPYSFAIAGGPYQFVVLDGTGFLSQISRDSFDFHVLMPVGFGLVNPTPLLSTSGANALLDIVQHNWTVAWVGVEG